MPERNRQNEIPRSLNRLGLCVKLETDTQVCYNCRTRLNPRHTGLADYLFVPFHSGKALFIEAKAGTHLFEFAHIKPEQDAFLRELSEINAAWLWLFMEPQERVRVAYLVAYQEVLQLREELAEFGIRSVALAPHWSKRKVIQNNASLTLERFAKFQLEWLGYNVWRPNIRHPLWEALGDYYDKFVSLKPREWFKRGTE